jgi:hypothetical protein
VPSSKPKMTQSTETANPKNCWLSTGLVLILGFFLEGVIIGSLKNDAKIIVQK